MANLQNGNKRNRTVNSTEEKRHLFVRRAPVQTARRRLRNSGCNRYTLVRGTVLSPPHSLNNAATGATATDVTSGW